jgi:MFS family permease
MANMMNSPKTKSVPPVIQQLPQQQQQIPKKFFPLVGYILKSAWGIFKKQLPMMILFGVLGWLLHTYLLVVINQGFGPGNAVGNFLATQGFGNTLSGTIIWMIVSGFLFGWIGQLISRKGKTAPQQKQPGVMTMFHDAGGLVLAAILATAGLSLFIGIIVNRYANLTMALGTAGVMFSQGGSVVSLLISSAWSSTYGLAQNKKSALFSSATGRVAMVGGIAGFLLSTLLSPWPWSKLIFGIGMLAIAFVLTRRQGQSFTTILLTILPLMIIMAAFAVLTKFIPVLADDGGWQESGGTFSGWVHSAGAVQAVTQGIGPGIGAVVGPAIGQALVTIGANINPGNVGIPVTQTPPPDAPAGPTIMDEDGKPMTNWEQGKYGPDETGNVGNPGDVWLWGKWVKPETARQEIAQEIANHQHDEAERQKSMAEWEANNAREREKDRIEGQRTIDEANKARAQAQIEQQLRDRMISRLQQDKSISDQVDSMIASNDYNGLKEIYRGKLQDQIDQGQKDSAYYQNVATAYGVATKVAEVTVTASKAALITVGGPAGVLVTATAVGTVSAAQEGSESYMRGDSIGTVVEHTAAGFLSGAKDGAIGVYTNLPGVGTATKILLPAAADTAENFVRLNVNNPENLSESEIIKRSMETGTISIVSNFVGTKVDGIDSTVVREITKAGVAGVTGGANSLVNGGSFGEGFQQGLEGAVGATIGSHTGSYYANRARSETEQTVQNAINQANAQKSEEIPMSQQPEIIKQLKDTYHAEGYKEYVDPELALKQLQDTQSSRTAKQAPDDIKDAIINTRQEKIYAPADAETIKKAQITLTENGTLQPGDKLKMDSFSTPGKRVSLGADRDARLVIERFDPATGKTNKLEVDRQHWENDAYKDFYDHTTKIAGGPENITPETQPEYFKRLDEMQYLKGSGLTDEQIQHRAWAEAHNQLFTDKSHVEASADNSDQITRFVDGAPAAGQKTSNVVTAQNGNERLLDPAGYAKMWQEKSQAYARIGNQPEAIAQSQKGIEQYMKLRDGYHAQGLEVPPVDNRTAQAMKIISEAPVGVDATPQAMEHVQNQLKALGYQNTNDALGKIATQNEVLKWSKPRAGLGTNITSELGKDAPNPDEV